MTTTANAPPAAELDVVLTTFEAADRLRCHPETVRRLCRTGQLASFRDRGLLRIRATDLAAYINRNTRED